MFCLKTKSNRHRVVRGADDAGKDVRRKAGRPPASKDKELFQEHKTSTGYVLRNVKQYRVLTFFEKRELVRVFQDTTLDLQTRRSASDKLVKHNLRFISKRAFRFYDLLGGTGSSVIDASELIQEGVIGFLKGVSRFDLSKVGENGKPYDLLTYVTDWVDNEIARSIKNNKLIRVPIHVLEEMVPVQREFGSAIAAEHRVLGSRELAERCNMPQEQVEEYRAFLQDHVSLDHCPFDERDVTVGDLFPDSGKTHDEIASRESDRQYLLQILSEHLLPEDAEFIRRRFGLRYAEGRTRQQMAAIYRQSEHAIKKTEKRILSQLKAVIDPARLNCLQE